ncbi:MAG: hypothetical protein ACO3SN_07645 [Burkholderiaceae bacterium]|jgi:hypothetical protein
MRAVAENPKFAKKVGVPQSVGKEFTMKKMMSGGVAASKMGKVKTAAPSRDGVATKGKTRGTMIKMAAGGMPMVMKGGKKVPAFAADGKGKMAAGGMAKKKKESTAKMDSRAEKAGRKVTKDIEYDDKMDRMRKMMKGGMTKMRYGGKC